MTIQATCECGYVCKADDQYAGRKAKCPKCGKGVLLPQAEAYQLAKPAALSPPPPPMEFKPAPALDFPVGVGRNESAEDEAASELDRSLFRRHFFAVWCCVWALRIAGWLTIAWAGLIVCGSIAFFLVGVAVSDKNTKAVGPLASLGFVELVFFVLPALFGAFTLACILLAASQLLTALAWSYLRQGLGGAGPIDA
jgi:hypothetical protein